MNLAELMDEMGEGQLVSGSKLRKRQKKKRKKAMKDRRKRARQAAVMHAAAAGAGAGGDDDDADYRAPSLIRNVSYEIVDDVS